MIIYDRIYILIAQSQISAPVVLRIPLAHLLPATLHLYDSEFQAPQW